MSPSWLSLGLACALLVSACGDARQDRQLDFYSLGTEISVSLYDVSDAQAEAASIALTSHFAEVGHNWYPWSPGELHAINAAFESMSPAMDVSPRLAAVIRRAAELERLSDGRFNARMGHLTELWGLHDLGTPISRLPDPAIIQGHIENIGAAVLVWNGDRMAGEQTFHMLDLGGIAKGAILEDAVNILQGLGVSNAIVNIGGDLTVHGNVQGRAAHIGIRSPVASGPLASIDLAAGETIVTSGNYERFVEIDGHRYTHILDPRTGYPVEHTASVTVVHTDPLLADAAATALMVGGSDEFDQLTQSMGIDFALLIDVSGDLRLTQAMRERLHWID